MLTLLPFNSFSKYVYLNIIVNRTEYVLKCIQLLNTKLRHVRDHLIPACILFHNKLMVVIIVIEIYIIFIHIILISYKLL